MSPDLRGIVADILDLRPDDIDDDFGPAVTDRWDSLSHLRIVTAVEEEFGVQFSMDEIQSIDGFGALRLLIAAKRE
jgi:acyl carrier protein